MPGAAAMEAVVVSGASAKPTHSETASRTSRKLGCVAARLALRGHKARPFGSFPKLGFCSPSVTQWESERCHVTADFYEVHPKPIRIPLTQIRPEERTLREKPRRAVALTRPLRLVPAQRSTRIAHRLMVAHRRRYDMLKFAGS